VRPQTFDGKVFGIGLSKTGTTSLGLALNRLGIATIDFPHDPTTLRQLENGDYRLHVLERYRAVTDTPVAPYYAQLDKLFPGSKFILTVRDPESWLRSVEEHWKFSLEWAEHHRDFYRFAYFMHVAVYGSYAFERDRYAYVYAQHTRNVLDYFKDRPDDLLVLNVCAGESWEKLCPFLQLPVLEEPFPRVNTREEKSQRRVWLEMLSRAQSELEQTVPAGATVALVDDGQFGGSDLFYARGTVPFTEAAGHFNGPPADSDAAIAELDRLRKAGAHYVVFGWPAFWWLEHYREFARYLRETCACRLENERLVIFELSRLSVEKEAGTIPEHAAATAPSLDSGCSLDELIDDAQEWAAKVDLDWAKGAIDPSRWTLTEDALRFVAGLTLRLQPRHILELGPGVSTRLFCRISQELSHPLTVSSIDHDPEFGPVAAEQARAEAGSNVRLQSLCAPVVVRTCCERLMPMYHLTPETFRPASANVDLVLIDGPPAQLGGREATLYQLMDYAKSGTIVLLDDACRSEEQAILRRWQDNLGEAISVRVLEGLGQGLAVIAVHQPVPQPSLRAHRLTLTARDLADCVPPDTPCIFVDGGQLDAQAMTGRQTHPFIERENQDWGAPPDDEAALEELDRWLQRDLRYLVFAWPAFWWLDHYQRLHHRLQRQARCVLRNDRLVIFELTPPLAEISS
jgi:hypothetical protein